MSMKLRKKMRQAFLMISGVSYRRDNDFTIVHFGYHKAMTVYFGKVLEDIAVFNGWHYRHHNSDVMSFYRDVFDFPMNSIISVNNAWIDFDKLPDYKGCHLIRDPRDLLVSGYNYHLWCKEPWALAPMSEEFIERLGIYEMGLKDQVGEKSYQELLRSISIVDGLTVELNWRRFHFEQMGKWNYMNSRILELRYENFFGNEVESFRRLFEFLGFSEREITKYERFVAKYSFTSLKRKGRTGQKRHAAKGMPRQWKNTMTEEIKTLFKLKYGMLLVDLGYEKDEDW